MRVKEIRELKDDELANQLISAKEDLFRLRFRHYTGQLDQSHVLGENKKNIARLYTVQKERQLNIAIPTRKDEATKKETAKKKHAVEEKTPAKEPKTTSTKKIKKSTRKVQKKKTKKKMAKKKTKAKR